MDPDIQLCIHTGSVLFDPFRCEWFVTITIENGPMRLVDVTDEMSKLVAVTYEDGAILIEKREGRA